MKLRVKGNSIRLRLTQGEVRQLESDGKVEETVDFGPRNSSLVYGLEAAEDVEILRAEFVDGRLRVLVPGEQAAKWAASDLVGFESTTDGLRILVEKDFACIKPRAGEDESDMFLNPDPSAC